MCSAGLIGVADLPDALQATATTTATTTTTPGADASIDQQAHALLQQLRDAHWNVAALARQLGCARMTLYRRMARWGIRSPNALDGDAAPH